MKEIKKIIQINNMQVTNLEVSQKLKEIGFETETHSYWKITNGIKMREYWTSFDIAPPLDYIPAWDLETLISALPDKIKYKNNSFFLEITKYQMGYFGEDKVCPFYHNKKDDESLADCAGILIYKLHEKGLIKFK